MNVTVYILCYKSKTLLNGEHPLVIRICKDGKKKYQSIGISVKAEFWDFNKNQPKRNCPNKESFQSIILEKTKEYSEQIIEFKTTNKNFTISSLIQKVDAPTINNTVQQLFDSEIQ